MPVYGPWEDQTDATVDATTALDAAFESRIVNSGTDHYDDWATQVAGGFGDMTPRFYAPSGLPNGERLWWLRTPADSGDPTDIQGVAHTIQFGVSYELLVSDTADAPAPDGAYWEYEGTYSTTPLARLVQVVANIEIIPALPLPSSTITRQDMTVVAYKSPPGSLGYFGFNTVPTRTSSTGRTSSDVQGFSSRQQTTLAAASTSTNVTLTITPTDIIAATGHDPAARFEVVPWGYSGDGPPAITGSADFSGGSAVLRPTYLLTYHRARKRLVTTAIPPLRQVRRDDGPRQFVSNGPTSSQSSVRQGPRGTYL